MIANPQSIHRYSLRVYYEDTDAGGVVYHANYVRPAMLDDLLVVETETQDVGGATVLLRQTVSGPKGVCATVRIRLACVRIGGNKPARIPPRWREALSSLRHQDDAGLSLRHQNDAGSRDGS